jgi:hypothetical protein
MGSSKSFHRKKARKYLRELQAFCPFVAKVDHRLTKFCALMLKRSGMNYIVLITNALNDFYRCKQMGLCCIRIFC